jgi:hypothetical protein
MGRKGEDRGEPVEGAGLKEEAERGLGGKSK